MQLAFLALTLAPTAISPYSIHVEAPTWYGSARRNTVVRASYAFQWGGAFNCSRLMQELTAQHTPSYSFLLEDSDGSSYLAAVECLDATKNFTVDGVGFTAWFTLIPPSEGSTHSCSVPADSPLTPFNETSLFNTSKGLRKP